MPDFKSISIALDLDGTLVDTAPDLAGAMNAVLVAEGRATLDPDSVTALVGHGARALIERGFAETGDPVRPGDMERLVALFLDHYREHVADASKPFDGVPETLQALRADGARLAVCTNKPEGLARLLLHKLDLFDEFETIIGGDSLAARKPDPLPIQECAVRLGIERTIVMVGDSTADAGAAHAYGCPFIFAAYGYADTPESQLAPSASMSEFSEAPRAIAAALPGLTEWGA